MKEVKDKLRNRLFERFFENENGIILTDLVDMIKPVVGVWQNFHLMLQKNCEFFNEYSHLDTVKVINKDDCDYLFIKIDISDYLIIDLKSIRVLDKDEVFNNFDEEFFCKNFDEKTIAENIKFTYFYDVEKYDGDVSEFINFYDKYKDILVENNKIFYKVNIDEAISYINISLLTGRIYLNFQTPDQFLYEQLWLNPDLTPSKMQDAHNKIGIDKMMEMFERVKEVKIPIECISKNVYDKIIKNNEDIVGNNKEKVLVK